MRKLLSESLVPMTLWQILLKAQAQADAALTCDECLAILDYLADQAADGADLDSLLQALTKHMARCPGCRERYLRWLRKLEFIAHENE